MKYWLCENNPFILYSCDNVDYSIIPQLEEKLPQKGGKKHFERDDLSHCSELIFCWFWHLHHAPLDNVKNLWIHTALNINAFACHLGKRRVVCLNGQRYYYHEDSCLNCL